MMIRPHTDPTLYAPGGKYEPTAENFPCCKLFLPCTEALNDDTLTDVIGGSIVKLSAGAGSGAGYVNITGSNNGLPLGRSIAVGNLAAMLIVSTEVSTVVTPGLHNSAGNEGFFASSAGNAVDSGAVSHALGTSLADSETHALLCRGGSANSPVGHKTTNAAYTAGTPVVVTPDSIVDMTHISLSEAFGTTPLYGMAFFVFANGFPAANIIKDTITWCHWNWRTVTKNKGIYPGLKGVA